MDVYAPQIVKPALRNEPKLTQLAELRADLLRSFHNVSALDLNYTTLHVEVAAPGSAKHLAAEQIIRYGYCSRYLAEKDQLVELTADDYDPVSTSRILVATMQVGRQWVVVGTLRVRWGDTLEVFQLFEIGDGTSWPHCADTPSVCHPGEFARFALHPIFDASGGAFPASCRQWIYQQKTQIFHQLWSYGLEVLQSHGVTTPYYITSPDVAVFCARSGLNAVKVEQAIPKSTENVQRLRHTFAQYWKPDHPREAQPAVYISPWRLLPLSRAEGRQPIADRRLNAQGAQHNA